MQFPGEQKRPEVFDKIADFIGEKGFNIVDSDRHRPWGGFFVVDEAQTNRFIKEFFPGHTAEEFSGFTKLSPKILLVEPGKRLSWQYHHRRAEIWRVVAGSAGVVVSSTNKQGDVKMLGQGDEVELKQGERHRLVGLNKWGIVAEIWKHTDPENPSDEKDIVRLEDDYGR